MLKCKGTSDEETDKIITPIIQRICWGVYELAVFKNTVLRCIGANIGLVRGGTKNAAEGFTCIENFQYGAGLGVSLGKKEEIICEILRQGNEIGLSESSRPA